MLSVTLDDGLARSFVVTPPRGAQGLRELRATAAARFAALYGESAEHWLLVGDWHASFPFIVCALPRPLYQALDQWAQAHSWRLDSLTPALVRVCNRLCTSIPADGWLAGRLRADADLAQYLQRPGGKYAQPAPAQRAGSSPRWKPCSPRNACAARIRARAPKEQSLLWAGAADWLPLATAMAGLESRTIRLCGLFRRPQRARQPHSWRLPGGGHEAPEHRFRRSSALAAAPGHAQSGDSDCPRRGGGAGCRSAGLASATARTAAR
jgi:hypothetical protein